MAEGATTQGEGEAQGRKETARACVFGERESEDKNEEELYDEATHTQTQMDTERRRQTDRRRDQLRPLRRKQTLSSSCLQRSQPSRRVEVDDEGRLNHCRWENERQRQHKAQLHAFRILPQPPELRRAVCLADSFEGSALLYRSRAAQTVLNFC